MYWEVDENYEEVPKICPLTGDMVDDPGSYDCYKYKCGSVKPDLFFSYHGYMFRCNKEYQDIMRLINKNIAERRLFDMRNDSIEVARKIDIDAFYSLCASINKYLICNRQKFDKNMQLCPYLSPDEKFIFCLFDGDNVVDVNAVSNMFAYFNNQRLPLLRDSLLNYSVGYCVVPKYLADAILVKLRLLYRLDIKSVLKNDNPVYIKSQHIGSFMYDVYGLNSEDFRQIRKKHLEMTEIANFDNVIYIKQEIDEIIKRELI